MHILEECIVHCITSSLGKLNQAPSEQNSITTNLLTQYESLILVSVEKVYSYMKKYTLCDDKEKGLDTSYQFTAPFIARSLIWLFMTQSNGVPSLTLTKETIEDCLSFANEFFRAVTCLSTFDSIAMDTAMDLCSCVSQETQYVYCYNFSLSCP